MATKEALQKLHTDWSEKCTCELKPACNAAHSNAGGNTATQAVFGNGNPVAEVVFIGEAPGKNEDKEGVPFVGAAGKFLDEMLKEAGIKRDDIYITNIVKYRPPNNRDPLPSEINACAKWLAEELKAINPKLIVFLGRHSMNHFFSDLKISEVHGKLLIEQIEGFPTKYFFPLYHPAAALYNGGMRKTLIKDFKKIPTVLKKLSILSSLKE